MASCLQGPRSLRGLFQEMPDQGLKGKQIASDFPHMASENAAA